MRAPLSAAWAARQALGELIEGMEAKERGNGCHTAVFVARKRDAEMVAADIRDSSRVRAQALHGDLTQARRDSVLGSVKAGRTSVLVATDVAARGLDVRSIKQVVNFDMPNNMEDYIHRIGRTGRAGAKGAAHTFLNPTTDEALVANLYERAFRIELGSAISLVYCGLGWGDEEVRTLIAALQWATDERIAGRVRTLDVKDNPITREPLALKVLVNRRADSMGVLARAVHGGMLPGLRDLHVDRKWCEESLELRKACHDRKIKLSGQHVDVAYP